MDYNQIKEIKNGDTEIIHEALILQWTNLAERIQNSSNTDNIKNYAKKLIRTIEMIEEMEDIGYEEKTNV